MPEFLFDFRNDFPSSKFCFEVGGFGRGLDSSETTGPVERQQFQPLAPERQAELDAAATVRHDQEAQNRSIEAEEFSAFEASFDEELGLAEGGEDVEGSDSAFIETADITPVEMDEHPVLLPQERYELRQAALNDSFIGKFVPDLAEVSAGRGWEKKPDDHWSLSGIKSAANLTTATLSNMLIIGEEVVDFGWDVIKGTAVGAYDLVTEPKETIGKIGDFFGKMSWEGTKNFFKNTGEDIATTWDNTPWEGLVGKGAAFVVDMVIGAKGLGKLSKLRKAPARTTTASAEVAATTEAPVKTTAAVEAMATSVDDLARSSEALIPMESPEFARRLQQLREVVPGRSRMARVRLENEFFDRWLGDKFPTREMARERLEAEVRTLRDRLNRGELPITHNFSHDKLGTILRRGRIKTKHEIDKPKWEKRGSFDEERKRRITEQDAGYYGLNPKSGGLDGGTNRWGDVQAIIDINTVRDRVFFTHDDIFNAGIGKNRPSTAQLTLEDALYSRAIQNIEGDFGVKSVAYTEAQLFGNIRLGEEITELIVPMAERDLVESLRKNYPTLKITYK